MTDAISIDEAGAAAPPAYTRKDFESDQAIRWCPGCGDYSVLAQMQRVMPSICAELGIKKENIVFISGIGCASRFPYYMDTFGFHGIHGRAPALASGLKLTRPDLQVWVVTGDGDGLSIGGNHLMHCLRRNIDVKILLFNNRIYGLTKGQYSPTSELGKKTKSSPMGTVEPPLNPLYLAMTSEATFVARAIDTDVKHLQAVLKRAAAHRGSAFVEIIQNCNVFNDGAFESFTARAVKDEQTIVLQHRQPLIFGKDRDKGVILRAGAQGVELKIVNVDDVDEAELVVHDETSDLNLLARILSRLSETDFPVPLGVFKAVEKPPYEELLNAQIDAAQRDKGKGDLFAHLHAADTWTV